MFCRNCGKEMKSNDIFCRNCGANGKGNSQPIQQPLANYEKQAKLALFWSTFGFFFSAWLDSIIGLVYAKKVVKNSNADTEAYKKAKLAIKFSIVGFIISVIIYAILLPTVIIPSTKEGYQRSVKPTATPQATVEPVKRSAEELTIANIKYCIKGIDEAQAKEIAKIFESVGIENVSLLSLDEAFTEINRAEWGADIKGYRVYSNGMVNKVLYSSLILHYNHDNNTIKTIEYNRFTLYKNGKAIDNLNKHYKE